MFHKFDIYGWHDGTSATGTERSTSIAPASIPGVRVDGQAYPNFTGYEWVSLVYPGTTRQPAPVEP